MKEIVTIEIMSTDKQEITRRIQDMELDGWANIGGEPIVRQTTTIIGVRREFERDVNEEEHDETRH